MGNSLTKVLVFALLVSTVLTACAGTPQPPDIQATIAAAVAGTQAAGQAGGDTPGAIEITPPPSGPIPTVPVETSPDPDSGAGVTLTPTSDSESAPVINSFTATPGEVNKGGAVVIVWAVTNADEIVLLSPDQSTLSASGQKAFNIDQNTTFTLRATNSTGKVEQSLVVKVKGYVPTIQSFTANPSILIPGQTDKVVLSWTVLGAPGVSIDGLSGQTFPATGSVEVPTPTANTTYTLVATNEVGTVRQQLTVTISSANCVVANVPSGRTLYLLDGPAGNYSHLIALTNGTVVDMIGRNSSGDWMKARALGREGWVEKNYLTCGHTADFSAYPTVAPNLIPTPEPSVTP